MIVGELYYTINSCAGYLKPQQIVKCVSYSSDGWAMVRPVDGVLQETSRSCTEEGYPDCVYVRIKWLKWYDEQSAMREIPKADSGTRPNLLAVDEGWLLPAGTFFRVNGKHTPLYLVMSNSHVFNLTEKQMHTTCSSRFKNVQLSVANVQLSEVL